MLENVLLQSPLLLKQRYKYRRHKKEAFEDIWQGSTYKKFRNKSYYQDHKLIIARIAQRHSMA